MHAEYAATPEPTTQVERRLPPPSLRGREAGLEVLPPSITPADLDKYLENVPPKHRNLMGRALLGACRSPREGIKAKCLECSNFAREEAAACRVWKCPLWMLNPYR